MALDFPSSPSNGDIFTDAGSGTEWVYNSADKSWTMTGAGSSSPFDFRGGYDFTTANTISDLESGDLFIHESSDGTVGSGYAGITGDLITAGTLVLWDGDSFVMLSSSVPNYPDTSDPNYQNGTLDDRYLNLAANAGAQIVKSTSPTEYLGGLKVTGGTPENVIKGVSGDGTSLRLVNTSNNIDPDGRLGINSTGKATVSGSNAGFAVQGVVTGSSSLSNAYRFAGKQGADTQRFNCYQAIGNVEISTTTDVLSDFVSYTGTGVPEGTIKEKRGFECVSGAATGTDFSKGFYSDFAADGEKVFNFFSNGSAPNYLKGSTFIGGTTARNTLELWKSTLTEEQLEQLEAGTLVAPANVATPGDGAFARSWYYDQQDAEAQAELDAGTLDYPEHLAAATFTDTFAISDTTSLALLSNGSILCNVTGKHSFAVQKNSSISPRVEIVRNGNNTSGERLFAIGTTDYPLSRTNNDKANDGIFNISADGSIYSSGNSENYFNALIESAGGFKVSDATKGVILTSPNGTEYRLTVDDSGTLTTTAV